MKKMQMRYKNQKNGVCLPLDFKAKHLEEISDRVQDEHQRMYGDFAGAGLQGYVYRTANHYYGKKI